MLSRELPESTGLLVADRYRLVVQIRDFQNIRRFLTITGLWTTFIIYRFPISLNSLLKIIGLILIPIALFFSTDKYLVFSVGPQSNLVDISTVYTWYLHFRLDPEKLELQKLIIAPSRLRGKVGVELVGMKDKSRRFYVSRSQAREIRDFLNFGEIEIEVTKNRSNPIIDKR